MTGNEAGQPGPHPVAVAQEEEQQCDGQQHGGQGFGDGGDTRVRAGQRVTQGLHEAGGDVVEAGLVQAGQRVEQCLPQPIGAFDDLDLQVVELAGRPVPDEV